MDDILETISNQIRDLRVSKKITQQELAERTNLSVPYISQIENSHRNISLETFVKIVDALEVLICGVLDVFAQRCLPVGMVFQG